MPSPSRLPDAPVHRRMLWVVVNTLVLAYAGASLALLVVVSTGGLPLRQVLTSEVLAEEIVRTLVGSIGLVLAVPAATAMAAVLATAAPDDRVLS